MDEMRPRDVFFEAGGRSGLSTSRREGRLGPQGDTKADHPWFRPLIAASRRQGFTGNTHPVYPVHPVFPQHWWTGWTRPRGPALLASKQCQLICTTCHTANPTFPAECSNARYGRFRFRRRPTWYSWQFSASASCQAPYACYEFRWTSSRSGGVQLFVWDGGTIHQRCWTRRSAASWGVRQFDLPVRRIYGQVCIVWGHSLQGQTNDEEKHGELHVAFHRGLDFAGGDNGGLRRSARGVLRSSRLSDDRPTHRDRRTIPGGRGPTGSALLESAGQQGGSGNRSAGVGRRASHLRGLRSRPTMRCACRCWIARPAPPSRHSAARCCGCGLRKGFPDPMPSTWQCRGGSWKMRSGPATL